MEQNKAEVFLGIDIGRTSVKCLLYDRKQDKFSNLSKIPLRRQQTAQQEIEENITGLIRTTLRANGFNNEAVSGIGVSSAALFDKTSGDIVNWPNNPLWNGFPLQKYLVNEFDTIVRLEDDANAYAIGEYEYGIGNKYHNMAYITISSGIGCGLILNRSIYKGENGWAGELGHIRIPGVEEICVCGKRGCLQSVASGPALFRKAMRLNNEQSAPHLIHELKDVVELAKQNISWAVSLFNKAAAFLAYGIEYLVMLFDIEIFILGGGVTLARDLLLSPLRHHLSHMSGLSKRKVLIERSTLEDRGGAMGAIYLALKN